MTSPASTRSTAPSAATGNSSGQGVSKGRHLLGIADLGANGIERVLRVSDSFAEVGRRAIPKVPALKGRTVVSLFSEPSTRTRLSFETAARRLSADVLTFTSATSSVTKGESLRDTVQTIGAMGVDAFVVRHPSAGAPARVAQWVQASVVNAGDGWHEHPTQALLDCYAIRQVLAERAGMAASDTGTELFAGLRVAIVGDIAHSRVARSEVLALSALGAQVVLVCPASLLPPSLDGWPVTVSHDLDAVIGTVDVCYLLRVQSERGSGERLPSLREYTTGFGLTARRAAQMDHDAFVMHPGPLNRGVEIAADVADLPRALILQQVAAGIAVRMAVLYLLVGTDAAVDGDGGGDESAVGGAPMAPPALPARRAEAGHG